MLGALRRIEKAIAAYEELIGRFKGASEAAIQDCVASASANIQALTF